MKLWVDSGKTLILCGALGDDNNMHP